MKTLFGIGSGSEFGKIVAMDRFDNGRSLSPIRQAEAYWTALLNRDSVPMRSQIDPRGLENILEYTFILERIAPGLARFRLAGSHLNALAGMEVRGMPLTAFFQPDDRAGIKDVLEQVFAAPAVAELGMTSGGVLGRTPMQARMILLPLKSDLGDVSRVLGVMIADGAIGKTPRRFSISDTRIKMVSDIHVQIPVKPTPAHGFAEVEGKFKHPAKHLRLIVSRDD
ncbi:MULTISPECIES: PAS domain-containing protein [unclassified Ruegeria]|uniref:PAS domain-containing protein n=1 Tax=unclassified Ruegeria TaxID=2625375 RepID=UPI001492FAF0|nr:MULTISPECIES: PAS domain-containing protein [unclassified Ruegeria]NOD46236.1 PAS domain-containing protein [Ruegeria sp. HKCCD5849]NOD50464.1 PAS domain-containing protein [Ruegeria sp. HKCCD5851]NOD67280.1 PAS domain-containing protein [Ruegeria sp. HKCCD7303]